MITAQRPGVIYPGLYNLLRGKAVTSSQRAQPAKHEAAHTVALILQQQIPSYTLCTVEQFISLDL